MTKKISGDDSTDNKNDNNQEAAATSKIRVVRPTTVHLVTHSYTCSHLYDNVVSTDQLGAYFSERNAILAAVQFIEKEFKMTFQDKDTWENEDEDDDNEEEVGAVEDGIREFYASGEWTTEEETEGVDEHTIRIESVEVADA